MKIDLFDALGLGDLTDEEFNTFLQKLDQGLDRMFILENSSAVFSWDDENVNRALESDMEMSDEEFNRWVEQEERVYYHNKAMDGVI